MSAPIDRDFESSELGTKEHWDSCYSREFTAYCDTGDVGEIWFGEDSQERVLDWIDDCDKIEKSDAIIDVGCGNGVFLVELAKRGFTNLVGVDYSEGAINLAQSIVEAEGVGDSIQYQVVDLLQENARDKYTCLTRDYKVCHDKGTYDAISLMPSGDREARLSYLSTVKQLLIPEGLLIITSCNWTKDQLMAFFSQGNSRESSLSLGSFLLFQIYKYTEQATIRMTT